MSDISDILSEGELDVTMMAQLKGLTKSDFVRMLGHRYDLEYVAYVPDHGRVTYKFTLEQVNPRLYINHGYAEQDIQG